ncbi:MAG: hypothetical protein R2751_01900 [Bacteroidales bacterium]
MKKGRTIVRILGGLGLLLAAGLIVLSCEGPEGPQGPAGVAGTNGTNGTNGTDGEDANETCIVCHNDEVVLLAKQQQAMSSHHLMGGNYERNSASCASCHTHQGFIEMQETGAVAGNITDPAPINCRTCHMIHMNYDESDWSLITTSAVDLAFGGQTVDLGGESNLCVNCHQFRDVAPLPVLDGEDVSITSSRWGPHHGPHGNNVWGVGGYLVAGSMDYPDEGEGKHSSVGCTTCHMAPVPYGGRASGGHSFNMTYEYHGSIEENIGACTTCHTSAETFDIGGVQTEVATLLAQLQDLLITGGYLNEETGLWNASSTTPIVASPDVAGAMLNYLIVAEDRSLGVHNPDYMVALLTNSIEAITPE